MKTEIKLQLSKAPKSSGGVKYEGDVEGETRPFSVYVPQVLFTDKKWPDEITVTVDTGGK
jgi:hypothetical protein